MSYLTVNHSIRSLQNYLTLAKRSIFAKTESKNESRSLVKEDSTVVSLPDTCNKKKLPHYDGSYNWYLVLHKYQCTAGVKAKYYTNVLFDGFSEYFLRIPNPEEVSLFFWQSYVRQNPCFKAQKNTHIGNSHEIDKAKNSILGVWWDFSA